MSKIRYTEQNILEAMQLFEDEHGYAPGQSSGIIQKGELANGTRKFAYIYECLFMGHVVGYPEKTTMGDFAKQHGLRVRSQKEIKIYTEKNILDAMKDYETKYGFAPGMIDSVIEAGVLANGTRTYNNIQSALKGGRVDGYPKGTSILEFAAQNGLKAKPQGIIYPKKRPKWPPLPLDESMKPSTPPKPVAKPVFVQAGLQQALSVQPISYHAVFRVVALQVLKAEKCDAREEEVLDLTRRNKDAIGRYSEPILHNTMKNPLVSKGYTWHQMVDDIRTGKIPDMPKNFDLAVFAKNVSDRFSAMNYAQPDISEVCQWMSVNHN